jgi:energy-converting hydrogenase B subunit D
MSVLHAAAFLLVGVTGTAVALCREPLRQVVASGIFGLALTALLVALQAPDVALSQMGIGGVALPVMIFLALAKIREHDE